MKPLPSGPYKIKLPPPIPQVQMGQFENTRGERGYGPKKSARVCYQLLGEELRLGGSDGDDGNGEFFWSGECGFGSEGAYGFSCWGKFHACGMKSYNRGVICWGFVVKRSTPPASIIKVYEKAAGNFFTCGILAKKDLSPICMGKIYSH